MAKYAYPAPFDYTCKKCNTEFYRKDLIRPPLIIRWLCFGVGICPSCKTKHRVFPVESTIREHDNDC